VERFKIVCGLFLLSVLVCVVPAWGDEIRFIHGSPEWLKANGSDTSTIIIQLVNSTNDPMPNRTIDFNITTPGMGSLNTTFITTNSTGYGVVNFTAGTKSGSAIIKCILRGNPDTYFLIWQKIDHDDPYVVRATYTDTVPVGTNTTILLRLLDKHGNPIDNRREVPPGDNSEQIRLFLSSSPQGISTLIGSWENISYNGTDIFNDNQGLPVNVTGCVELNLNISMYPGSTIIEVQPLALSGSKKYLSIQGVATGIPNAMDQLVNPTVRYQPANGNASFSLTYTLYDEYGNRLNGKVIHLITSEGQQYNLTTASDGVATMLFGPRTNASTITINANPVDNEMLRRSLSIEFYDPSPSYMGLTALPDNMPSLDLSPTMNSSVQVKITDMKGVPVSGLPVRFTINHGDYTNTTQTTPPYLETPGTNSLNETTDDLGYAIVRFMPGTFIGPSDVGFYQDASANCTIQAEWGGITKTKNLSWFHKPFISVWTNVSSSNVSINETVDVTIQVRGEGFASSVREPIDAILTTSRARSMLMENPDRMVFAYAAEQRFVDIISQSPPYSGTDHIGLLSMGGNPNGVADIQTYKSWSKGDAGIDGDYDDDSTYIAEHYPGDLHTIYGDIVTMDLIPTDDLSAVRAQISNTTPSASQDNNANQNEMPLRRAVYEDITTLRNATYTNNKYIILLVDSEITDYGDVLAQGNPNKNWRNMNGCTQRYYPFGGPDNIWSDTDPNQDMSVYARESGVKIYVIYATPQLNNCDHDTLKTLAESTGGAFNETGGDASKLVSIYDWIANRILDDAGKDISLTVNMGTLEVNNQWIVYDPEDPTNTSVFDYVSMPDESTRIRYFFSTNNTETNRTTINQSDEYYSANRTLTFTIGSLKIDQIWEATYRLVARMAGTINIFGSNTSLVFNNSGLTYTYELPSEWVNVPGNITHLQNVTYDLTITYFNSPNESVNSIPLAWALNYTGPNPSAVVSKLYYKSGDGGWVHLTNRNGLTGTYRLRTDQLPPGDLHFKLEASAPSSPYRQAFNATENAGLNITRSGQILLQ
jgi:hypothetical protein